MNRKQIVSAVISWITDGSAETDKVFAEGGSNLGAVVCGRLTYDLSVPWWKENGPTGEARLPVFVISDSKPNSIVPNGVYTFVANEDAAFELAKKAAQGRDVTVMGGAKTIQKFLNKDYIDEIQIQLIPIILGAGKSLFDNVNRKMKLKPIKTLTSDNAIHLGFSVERE